MKTQTLGLILVLKEDLLLQYYMFFTLKNTTMQLFFLKIKKLHLIFVRKYHFDFCFFL